MIIDYIEVYVWLVPFSFFLFLPCTVVHYVRLPSAVLIRFLFQVWRAVFFYHLNCPPLGCFCSVSVTVHFCSSVVVKVHRVLGSCCLWCWWVYDALFHGLLPIGGLRGSRPLGNARRPAQLSPDEVLALSVLRGCMVAGLAISSWFLPCLWPATGSSCNASCIPWYLNGLIYFIYFFLWFVLIVFAPNALWCSSTLPLSGVTCLVLYLNWHGGYLLERSGRSVRFTLECWWLPPFCKRVPFLTGESGRFLSRFVSALSLLLPPINYCFASLPLFMFFVN